MKIEKNIFHQRPSAFTLIEMIGILAIMTIVAGVMTPNILHSIERAAVSAESDSLHNLGSEIGLYLRDNAVMPTAAVPPTVPNWTTQLAFYSSLSSNDILTNKRQMTRLYVIDPVAANQRAMLLSSMRTGIALPTTAQVSGNFATIWNTANGSVPAAAGWGAWGAGPAPALNNIEYLVIERVSLASIYRTNLATYSWSLNNSSSTDTVSCIVTWANGSPPTTYSLVPNSSLSSAVLPSIKPGDKLAFYKSPSPTVIFSYVASDSGRTFTYTTFWVAQ